LVVSATASPPVDQTAGIFVRHQIIAGLAAAVSLADTFGRAVIRAGRGLNLASAAIDAGAHDRVGTAAEPNATWGM